jgi:hypothetical protein
MIIPTAAAAAKRARRHAAADRSRRRRLEAGTPATPPAPPAPPRWTGRDDTWLAALEYFRDSRITTPRERVAYERRIAEMASRRDAALGVTR